MAESGYMFMVATSPEQLRAYEVPLTAVPDPRTPSEAADLVVRALVMTPADMPTRPGRNVTCHLCPTAEDVILEMGDTFTEEMFLKVLYHMIHDHHDHLMRNEAFKRCWSCTDKVSLHLLLQGRSYYALNLLSCVVVQPTNRRPFHSFVTVC